MFKIIIPCIIIIIYSFYGCIQPSEEYLLKNNKDITLVGIWCTAGDTSEKIEFTSNGYFNMYNKEMGKMEFKFFIMENGKLVDKDYGKMRYNAKREGDSLNVILTGEKNDEFYAKRIYFIDGNNCLTEIIYKQGIIHGIDINDHIQVANKYHRVGTKGDCQINAPRHIFQLSKEFITPKIVYMVFGQSDGITGQVNQEEYTISYQIPNTNTLKIKELENVKSFAWELLDFYVEQEDGTFKKMKVLYSDDIKYFKANSYKQKIKLDYDINQLVVFANSRFNEGRTYLYEIFGEKVEGNELSFEVVLLKERLEEWGIDLNYVEYPKQK